MIPELTKLTTEVGLPHGGVVDVGDSNEWVWVSDEPIHGVVALELAKALVVRYKQTGLWPVFTTEPVEETTEVVRLARTRWGKHNFTPRQNSWNQSLAQFPSSWIESGQTHLALFRTDSPMEALLYFNIAPGGVPYSHWFDGLATVAKFGAAPLIVWNTSAFFALPDESDPALDEQEYRDWLKAVDDGDPDHNTKNPFKHNSGNKIFDVVWNN